VFFPAQSQLLQTSHELCLEVKLYRTLLHIHFMQFGSQIFFGQEPVMTTCHVALLEITDRPKVSHVATPNSSYI